MTQTTLRLYVLLVVFLVCFPLTVLHAPAAAAGSGGKNSSSASSHSKVYATVPGRQYDGQGRYTGRVDSNGRRYDAQGRFVGRIDSQNGRQYDSQGRYLGRVESNRRQYDAQGRYLGRVESNGRLYDDNGRYKGRIDADGRQYDTQGRYTGRLDAVAGGQLAPVAPTAERPGVKVNPAVQPALTVEGNRAVAPFVFCNHGDKNCGN